MLLCTAALLAQSYVQYQSIRTEIVRQREMEETDTLRASWKSGGITYEVVVPRIAGETEAQQWDRLDRQVAEGKRRHPPD